MYFALFSFAVLILYMIRGKHTILDLPLLFLIAEIAMPWIMGGEGFGTQHNRKKNDGSFFIYILNYIHPSTQHSVVLL